MQPHSRKRKIPEEKWYTEWCTHFAGDELPQAADNFFRIP